jgi:hypothetical protein
MNRFPVQVHAHREDHPLGAGLLGAAIALLLLGFWLVYLGATRLGRRHRGRRDRPVRGSHRRPLPRSSPDPSERPRPPTTLGDRHD